MNLASPLACLGLVAGLAAVASCPAAGIPGIPGGPGGPGPRPQPTVSLDIDQTLARLSRIGAGFPRQTGAWALR